MTITTTLPLIAFRGSCLSRPTQLPETYHQLWFSIPLNSNALHPFNAKRFKQNLELAKTLPGFNINHHYPFHTHAQQTLLHHAVIQKNTDACHILLAAGANPNVCDHLRQAPLHFATDPNTIKTLLRAGANPNPQDLQGRSPLHWAAQSHQSGTLARINTLIQGQASTTLPMRTGKTPADLAEAQHQTWPILHALDPERYSSPPAVKSAHAKQHTQKILTELSRRQASASNNFPPWDFGPYGKTATTHTPKTQTEPSLKEIPAAQNPFSRHVSFAQLEQASSHGLPPLPAPPVLKRSSSSLRRARYSGDLAPIIESP